MQPLDDIPERAKPLDGPEQLIDTLLLRNLPELCTAILGQSARFLFHSTEYWGSFDIGCVLSDGSLGLLENKGKSVNKDGFSKFCRDIAKIKSDPIDYVQHRFEHVLTYIDEYEATAQRMFSCFFLGLRCDTQKWSRDVAAEACQLLTLEQEEFSADFQKGLGWLERVREAGELPAYLKSFGQQIEYSQITPVFFVPHNCVARVEKWLSEDTRDKAVPALLASYRLYAEETTYPTWLSTEPAREILVSTEG